MAGPGQRWQGAVRRESAAAALAPDRQGAGEPGRSAQNGDFRAAQPAGPRSSAEAKRVCDAQPVLDDDAVVHAVRPERVALGVERGGGDHRVVDRKTIPLRERETGLMESTVIG